MSLSWFPIRRRDDRARDRRRRLAVESLEGRQLLSAIVVSNTHTRGAGSLRQAIMKADANHHKGPVSINFHVKGAGVKTFNLVSALPAITRPVVINGTTQAGFATPVIVLNGAHAGSTAIGLDLTAKAAGSTIEGLAIVGFAGGGILVDGGGNDTITANDLGVTDSGPTAPGNGYGITVASGAQNVTISQNVISGNNGNGVVLLGPATGRNVVEANVIGANRAGSAAVPNAGSGIFVSAATGNTIGGTSTATRNVISGNGTDGVYLNDGTANVVVGDYIGVNLAGTAALANQGHGVVIASGATGNTIGGSVAGTRDVISGNLDNGVLLSGPTTTGNVIEGDAIGTNPAGTAALPNGGNGVLILDASQNAVGGSMAAAGNVLSGNAADGVHISGGTANIIAGNEIGTDITGKLALPNVDGVYVGAGATADILGGTTPGTRNVISGNSQLGVDITDSGTSNNLVMGNDVGTDTTGTLALPNQSDGLDIVNGATGNTVGGTIAAARNVISANANNGLLISKIGTSNNLLEGNDIGVNAAGTAALPNVANGVLIAGGATSNILGGTTVGARNIISGNGQSGVDITDSGTSNNLLEGDFIGTDATGTVAVANKGHGVVITLGATANTVGGTAAGAGDVLSGNVNNGVALSVAATSGNVVEGDFIGTNAAGTAALPNGANGVFFSAASGNTIGGTTGGARNVISGNVDHGVQILSGAASNVVEGNDIGVSAAGTAALPNKMNGVYIGQASTANTIGGTTAAALNVISGNVQLGIRITDAGTSKNVVEGNDIGTDVTGKLAIPNQINGVDILSGATANTVGGTTPGARNVISGNTANGVVIDFSGASNNVVEGNYIGVNAAGTAALPNGIDGVFIGQGATANTIGGTTAAALNVLSGNTGSGVTISDAGTSNNLVEGDAIGTDATGTVALANKTYGAFITLGATANTVGGTTAGAGDVISGNAADGVVISASKTSGNVVEGDFIGTNAAGTAALANADYGVLISGAASGNTIGGTSAGARDVISGNTMVGIRITDAGTSNNLVEGNDIGTDATGSLAVPNKINGVDVLSGATANTVGGTTAGARNVISGNTDNGVVIDFGGASHNLVEGNFVGLNAGGTAALPNGASGVFIGQGATANTIGGTTAAALNVVSGNTGDGVTISDSGTSNNLVEGNDIGTDPTGKTAIPNGGNGVNILNQASTNQVNANVISGNALSGVQVTGSGTMNNSLLADLIGVNAGGTAILTLPGKAVGNGGSGVDLTGNSSATTVQGCVIAGNGGDGVHLDNGTANNVILGDFIGTDATGTINLGNVGDGVLVSSSNGDQITMGTIEFNGGFGIDTVNSTQDTTSGNTFLNNKSGDTN